MNTWMFAGKIGCLQNCGSVTSGKSDPCIFPWRFCIGTVDDLRIRIHKKGIFGRKKMGFVVDFVCAFSRNFKDMEDDQNGEETEESKEEQEAESSEEQEKTEQAKDAQEQSQEQPEVQEEQQTK